MGTPSSTSGDEDVRWRGVSAVLIPSRIGREKDCVLGVGHGAGRGWRALPASGRASPRGRATHAGGPSRPPRAARTCTPTSRTALAAEVVEPAQDRDAASSPPSSARSSSSPGESWGSTAPPEISKRAARRSSSRRRAAACRRGAVGAQVGCQSRSAGGLMRARSCQYLCRKRTRSYLVPGGGALGLGEAHVRSAIPRSGQ